MTSPDQRAEKKELTPREVMQLIRFARMLAGYGCAGVDQDPDDPAPCGKCAACEASKWLTTQGLR